MTELIKKLKTDKLMGRDMLISDIITIPADKKRMIVNIKNKYFLIFK